MGDMADYYMEQELYDIWPDPSSTESQPRITQASKWKTRDGQKIAIKDLKTDHLQNILKMYSQGRLQLPNGWLAALERERERRCSTNSLS